MDVNAGGWWDRVSQLWPSTFRCHQHCSKMQGAEIILPIVSFFLQCFLSFGICSACVIFISTNQVTNLLWKHRWILSRCCTLMNMVYCLYHWTIFSTLQNLIELSGSTQSLGHFKTSFEARYLIGAQIETIGDLMPMVKNVAKTVLNSHEWWPVL